MEQQSNVLRQRRESRSRLRSTTTFLACFFMIRFVSIGVYSWLEFVSAVCAEDEFPLEKDRFDLPC